MDERSQLRTKLAVALLLVSAMPCAMAGVVVTTSGNQAFATISLSDGSTTYDADVTITFDSPANLTAAELNLTAQLVSPSDFAITSRLPGCLLLSPDCVTVDPAFPMLITVEPLNLPWLFHSGFESGESPNGNLSFLNTYDFEVHTADLTYVDGTPYRLFKAPIGGSFDDISTAITSGSVRARGSGGTFSQFMVVSDLRNTLLVEQLVKEPELQTRILLATISNLLRTNLLNLLSNVQSAVGAGDYVTAIADLDQLIAETQANAGIGIANEWSSDRTLANDAGQILSLAQTLRFTLVRLQNGQ
jgi:hypothetical protein